MKMDTNSTGLSFILTETDPYLILGVPVNSELEEISKAYRSLAKNNHPDTFGHKNFTSASNQNEQIFQKITNAYNLLKDPGERKKYDSGRSFNIRQTQPGVIIEEELKKKETGNSFTFTKFQPVEQVSEKTNIANNATEAYSPQIQKVFEQAKYLIKQKRNDEAINLLKQLTNRFPKESRFHSHLGVAMLGKGWNAYAQSEFKIALHFNPNDGLALEHFVPFTIKVPEIKPVEKKKSLLDRLFGKD